MPSNSTANIRINTVRTGVSKNAHQRGPKPKKLHHNPIARFFTNGRSNRSAGGTIVLLAFIAVFACFSLFPVVYMAGNAFKPLSEQFRFPPKLLPINPTLANFYELWDYASSSLVALSRHIFNTLVLVLAGTAGNIVLSAMAAFPLAKFQFPGSKFLSSVIVYALMFSTAVTAVPNYIVMSYLGLIDTYLAVLLPACSSTLGLYLLKNFMEQVPDSLIEAGSIDGASEFYLLWRIIMPIVKPAWITVFIFTFQGLWGNTGANFIYTESLKPLSYMLGQIAAAGVARTGVAAATTLIMFFIPVIVFIITQSNILETMTTSGMKE